MKEIFSLINQKERLRLAVVAVLIGLTLLFYGFGALGVKGAYNRSSKMLEEVEKKNVEAERSWAEKETEGKKWDQTHKDMAELKESFFYGSQDVLKEFRLDLQRLLDQTQLLHSEKKFQYTHFEQEGISQVVVEFSLTGSYDSLKSFIHAVECFPKFLLIDRIDFLDIDPLGTGIKLRILLAGYYAEY
jgi:Tfp pilus assembly protein PilO